MAQNTDQVTDGPGKFQLMNGLFDGQRICFTVARNGTTPGHIVDVYVSSVEREDGSGESWNITARNALSSAQVKIYYHSRNRKGTITHGTR